MFFNLVNKLSVKLIDFDSSFIKNKPYDMKMIEKPKAMSEGYCAPELIKYFSSPLKSQELNDPSKLDIYSLGILMLEYMNFFNKYIPLTELDKFKTCKKDHQEKFLSLVDQFSETASTDAEKNLIYLIKTCLNYEPELRLSAYELLFLSQNIHSNNNLMKQMCINLFFTRSQNKIKTKK